jgi:DNA-binding transcriptional LysR family regulator
VDLRRIRHFIVLAETLSFSRAAERLHIAQPALSVSIQKLEAELGVRLFDRTPVGVQLSASGQTALVTARRLLYHGEQLARSMRDAADGTAGRLRVGFVGSAIYQLIPRLVPSFRAQYPGVELVLHEATSARIVQMLNVEALDVGIVRTPLLEQSEVQLVTLQSDRFVVAVRRDHPLAGRTTVALAALAREPFILHSPLESPGLHSATMATCQAAGFVPHVAQEATQLQTVIALVESGLGVALVPEVMRGQREPAVVYLAVDAPPTLAVTALAIAYMDETRSAAAQRFIELASPLGQG